MNGPWRGSKHDLTMFREDLINMLDNGEMVEADRGYRGEPYCIRTNYDYDTKQEKKEKGAIRARHETANHRFKVFGILKQQYRHDIQKHGLVFRAIACIVQIGIDNGDCLFGCTTSANKKDSYEV